MQACNKYAVNATIILSSLRQVMLHGVRSKKKKSTQARLVKQLEIYEYKVEMAEMQAISQAATEVASTVVKAITEVADLAKNSTRKKCRRQCRPQGRWTIEAAHI